MAATVNQPDQLAAPTCVDYHSHPAVSRTALACFRQSRRLYHARHVLRLPEAQLEPSDAMNLGTLCHAELLEPGSLEGKFAVLPMAWPDFRTKAAREWRDEQKAAGKIVVKAEAIAKQLAIVQSAAAIARRWIEAAAAIEQALFWVDSDTGLVCRCKPDWLVVTPETIYVLDFKTTGDASPSAFERQVNTLGLWLQDEHYSRGVERTMGDGKKSVVFLFVVVETEYPFRAGVHRIDRDGAAIANEYRDTLRTLAKCHADNDWREPWEAAVNPLRIWERSFRSDAMGRY